MPPARRKSPLAAAVLSAIIPGAGQWYAGERRRARLFLIITGLFVLPAIFMAVMVLYVQGLDFALTIADLFADHPDLFAVLLLVNVVALVFRAVAVVDAYLLAGGASARRSTAVSVLGLGFLLFLTAIPHWFTGEQSLATYSFSRNLSPLDPGQVAIEDVTTTTGVPSSGVTSTTLPPTTTSTTLSDVFPEEGRVSIILMGSDDREGVRGIRTDTMMVVSVDPQTGYTAIFGIPRNLIQIPFPADHAAYNAWSGCTGCFPLIANQLYGWGLERPDLFGGPNSGANATKVVFGYLLGIDIHYFAMVNMAAFIEVVDAVGGIDINVPYRVYEPAFSFPTGYNDDHIEWDIQPGFYHMDGRMALVYARGRAGSNDFDRMSRQRCVVSALAAQTDPLQAIQAWPDLAPIIAENVITDVPFDAIPEFINLLRKVDVSSIVSTRFMPDAPEFSGTPTSYIADWTAERYPIPNRDFIAETVASIINNEPEEAVASVGSGLQETADVCALG